MEIVGILVAGLIIGLLGKLVAPGDKDNIPIWLTLLCGIGGVLLGLAVYTAFGGDGSSGIDWTRWIVSIAIAAPPRISGIDAAVMASTLPLSLRRSLLSQAKARIAFPPGHSLPATQGLRSRRSSFRAA